MKQELVARVEDKIIEGMLLAQRRYNQSFDLPTVSFDLNGFKTAGLAQLQKWHIKINPRFLESYTKEVLARTVPHEIAHLITFKLFPNAKQFHGPEFRSVCRALGISESTYHSMKLPEYGAIIKQKRPYIYSCGCQNFNLTKLLHTRISLGQRRQCSKCKQEIHFVKKNV